MPSVATRVLRQKDCTSMIGMRDEDWTIMKGIEPTTSTINDS